MSVEAVLNPQIPGESHQDRQLNYPPSIDMYVVNFILPRKNASLSMNQFRQTRNTLTALSVGCNEPQLLDVAWKLFSDAKAAHKSQSGATSRTLQLETIARNVANLGNPVVMDNKLSLTLRELAKLTKSVASRLSDVCGD
jgi:hypothetical protein